MPNRALVLLSTLLLAAALAGCNEATPTQETPTLALEPGVPGIIGVVATDLLQPLKRATVSIVALNLTTTTDDDGAFAFQDLPAGIHRVRAQAPGYHDGQAQAEAASGDAAKLLRIVLEPLASGMPHLVEWQFDGFIECSIALVALCAAPNIGDDLAGTGNVTNDRFRGELEVEGTPTFIQSEMIWEANQQLSRRMQLSLRTAHSSWQFNSSNGFSPVLATVPEADAEGQDINENGFSVSAFSAGSIGDDPTCAPVPILGDICTYGTGLAVNQEFRAITYLFYGFMPDEGWRFSEHGAPIVPGSE